MIDVPTWEPSTTQLLFYSSWSGGKIADFNF